MKIIECRTEESNESIDNEKLAAHLNLQYCDKLIKDLHLR